MRRAASCDGEDGSYATDIMGSDITYKYRCSIILVSLLILFIRVKRGELQGGKGKDKKLK